YSEADRDAMHVAMADEAVLLGPARARDSYLNIERVIEAARQSGAEAVHPGYGFLSENAEFAQACADAGLIFVGPTAAMMTAMGSKSGSKMLMEKAGVPLVPGYHGEAQDEETLAKAADTIGFPILIKASAGGGVRRRAQGRRRGELCRCRHHRVRFRRQGGLLHRDEHPPAGRASGDRADHGHRSGGMAAARGVRRKAAAPTGSNQVQRSRHRGAGLRGKSAQEFHAVGRSYQNLAHP